VFALTLLLLRAITMACRGHHDVVLENLALRHQLRTLQRRVKRPHLRTRDRMFWVLLATAWRRWRSAWSSSNPRPSSDGIARGCVGGGLSARDATALVGPRSILSLPNSRYVF
jgi:hypothetical protein